MKISVLIPHFLMKNFATLMDTYSVLIDFETYIKTLQ